MLKIYLPDWMFDEPSIENSFIHSLGISFFLFLFEGEENWQGNQSGCTNSGKREPLEAKTKYK